MKRLFFGVEVPDSQKPGLMDVVHEGKKRLRSVKWVSPDCLHVTLKFLGNTPDALVADVVRAAELAAEGMKPMTLSLKAVGAFPSPSKPHILWAGVGGDVPELQKLAVALETYLEMLGFTPEERPFTAHVTLGRSAQRGDSAEFPVFSGRFENKELGAFVARRFVLYESQLTPRGPIYTPLAHIELKG